MLTKTTGGHAEFISVSVIFYKILKQVQDDDLKNITSTKKAYKYGELPA